MSPNYQENSDVRIIFAGTPEVAVPSLRALISAGHDVALVITREDAPVGRKSIMTPSPVASFADELGLNVMKTNRIGDTELQQIRSVDAELGVVVAFGLLFRAPLLSATVHGWLNLHFSALPRWRGAAPVQRALMAGERELGITVFRLDEGMDSGDIVNQSTTHVLGNQSAQQVLDTLAVEGANLVVAAVSKVLSGTADFKPQIGEPSYAPKLVREDGRILWARPANALVSQWAGVTPDPGAFTQQQENQLKIVEMAVATSPSALDAFSESDFPGTTKSASGRVFTLTGDGIVELLVVQPAGKTAMSARDWIRGRGDEVILS